MYLWSFLFPISIIFLILNISKSLGQEIETVNYDSIFVKSFIDNKIEQYNLNYSVLRYQSYVDILLLPSDHPRISETYQVEIFENRTSNPISIQMIGTTEVVRVPYLPKDKDFFVKVYKISSVGNKTEVVTNLLSINSSKRNEFRVSNQFYKAIGSWSSSDNQKKPLIDFLRENSSNTNLYELAAFLQYHYKLDDIDDIYSGNIAAYINNPPISPNTGGGNPDERTSKCNCSLILNTHRDAPSITESYSGSPEETNYLAVGNGAAKQMLLSMKGKHGGGKFEANIGGVVSPLYSIISYNLVCSDFYTDLPEECMCPKKILYDYSYTARLSTNAKKGGPWWPWSAGAEAAAEDYAILTIRNGGSVAATDGGRIRISSNCSSNWNSDWWTQAANVLVSAAGVAIDSNATIASWANILPQVVTLFSTNFFNKSGDCTDKNEINTLMAGSGELTMTTNKPVDILISSLGYEFVRGYGKWESRSTIVSDYHLAVVLLGQDLNRPECCTPNVADYHIGYFNEEIFTISFFDIPIKIFDASVNSETNLKGKVNRLFTLWGPWPGLVRDANGNYILEGNLGHYVRTFPNCAPVDPLQDESSENRFKTSNLKEIKLFPNPATNYLQINQPNLTEISIINTQGQLLIKIDLDINTTQSSIDISALGSGQYIIIAVDNSGYSWLSKFQKL